MTMTYRAFVFSLCIIVLLTVIGFLWFRNGTTETIVEKYIYLNDTGKSLDVDRTIELIIVQNSTESCAFSPSNPMYKELEQCNLLVDKLSTAYRTRQDYSKTTSDVKCKPNSLKLLSMSCETRSMSPTFDCTDTVTICDVDGNLVDKGDIVVFDAPKNDYNYAWFVHRVIQKNSNNSYYTMGDNNGVPDIKLVQPNDIKGLVVQIAYK